MKLVVFLLSASMICLSCKEKISENTTEPQNEPLVTKVVYPENLSKVFEAHGGLDLWKQMQTLKFSIHQEDGTEVTTVDLKSRKAIIDMPNHIIGNDGKTVWLLNKDTITYKRDPKFYNNLMFYFFAMPFVMADKGINYSDTEPLSVDGITYPGIKMTFDNGIGESPDDEYLLYYDKNTFKLTWLGYTVTYFSQEKSTEYHFMKYSNWQNVNGLTVPETMGWYQVENHVPTTMRHQFKFVDVAISNQKMASETFEKPESAVIAK